MEEPALLSHERAREWLHRALDGALSVEERAHLDEHLLGCPACRIYSARVQAFDRSLTRAVPLLYASPGDADSRRGAALRTGLARRSKRRMVATGWLAWRC